MAIVLFADHEGTLHRGKYSLDIGNSIISAAGTRATIIP
jgi:hypothetical protein